MKERDIFDAALAIADPGEREAFLNEACEGDAGMVEHLRGLLEAERGLGSFLESPASAPTLTIAPPPVAERAGTVIGPYKLLEPIGEGGMGVVYMAEQAHPVRRKVALKVIKPGMDTKHVIARFEAERQALALMDHPNIARVLDAGATESGLPYFVMELVRGVTITDYCDKARLPIPERLGLFVQVCHAVQHAHQKGIIHRDIKPSNVLITLHDGVPVPKVIDFGIAKATGQQLTEKTLFTAFTQFVGTPLYMSPEQAELSGLDVDTRSDIYSLGVLLYELLTGTTPFDKETLRKAALDEVRRIIREQEPPTPSDRLSSLGDALTGVSARRGSDPWRLGKVVRGELDWIAMRAMEKDRNRRYETASGLAADVRRYLADEPVQASPPSAWYRFSKAVRRNRVALATTALVASALLLGTAVSTWQAVRAIKAERDAATALRTEAEQKRLLAENLKLALQALDKIYLATAESRLPRGERIDPRDRELLQEALAFYQRFSETNRDNPFVRNEVASAYGRVGDIHRRLGDGERARDNYRRAISLREALTAEYPDQDSGWDQLAHAYTSLATVLDPRESERVGRQALSIRQRLIRDYPGRREYRADLVEAQFYRTVVLGDLGRWGEADELMREVLAAREGLVRDYPEEAGYQANLAALYINIGVRAWSGGDNRAAADSYYRALPILERLVANCPTEVSYRQTLALCCRNLCVVLGPDRREEKDRLGVRALSLREQLAAEFPQVPEYRHQLASSYDQRGIDLSIENRGDEAEQSWHKAFDLWQDLARLYPAEMEYRSKLGGVLHNMAAGLIQRGELTEARRLLEQAVAHQEAAIRSDPQDPNRRRFLRNHHTQLARVLTRQGDYSAASRAAEALAADTPSSWEDAFQAGTTLARCVPLAESDDRVPRAEREATARRLAGQVGPLFREAARRGEGDPEAQNKVAWFLATCPDPRFRDGDLAVKLARAAVALRPSDAALWNTMGMALYRAGDGKAAVEAIESSMKRSSGGDVNDWLILAMAHWQQGETEKARAWYRRAVGWMDKNRPEDDELKRFRAEAAALLGLADLPDEVFAWP